MKYCIKNKPNSPILETIVIYFEFWCHNFKMFKLLPLWITKLYLSSKPPITTAKQALVFASIGAFRR